MSRHEMIRHHARDVVGLQEKRRALAKHHWDLLDKIIGPTNVTEEEKPVTISLPINKKPWTYNIIRTHADGSQSVKEFMGEVKEALRSMKDNPWTVQGSAQTYVRGEGMERYGEEPTVPGVPHAEPEPTVFTKDEPQPAHEVPCPRIVQAPMEKGTRCYLCARQLDYFFERTPGDYSKICSSCVYSQLGYDIGNNGQLKRRPEEKPIK